MNFEVQMDVAGSNLKPHPCNFEKLCIFIDLQMILVSFFDVSNQKSVISKKTILFLLSTPKWVKILPIWG